MSQPVKLSDDLVLDARLVGDVAQRSIAGQIEFWARLGRAIEPLVNGAVSLALRRSGDAQPLSSLIESVESLEGRARVTDYLSKQPFPHYESCETDPELIVQIASDGRRTLGRFVNREFVPASKPKQARKSSRKAKP